MDVNIYRECESLLNNAISNCTHLIFDDVDGFVEKAFEEAEVIVVFDLECQSADLMCRNAGRHCTEHSQSRQQQNSLHG